MPTKDDSAMVAKAKVFNHSDKPAWVLSYGFCQVILLAFTRLVQAHLATINYFLPGVVEWIFIGLLAILLVLMMFAVWRKRMTYIWWEAVLLALAYGGVWILALSVLPVWLAVIVAAAVTLVPFFLSRVWCNNLVLLLGCVGVGLEAARHLPYVALLVCAAGVALYEALRARDTGLATLLSEAWHAGVAPGLLIPAHWRGWSVSLANVWQPGQGLVAGLLPFMAMSAMGFVAAVRGSWLFLVFALATIIIGLLIGTDNKSGLRVWMFSAVCAVCFAVMGLAQFVL